MLFFKQVIISMTTLCKCKLPEAKKCQIAMSTFTLENLGRNYIYEVIYMISENKSMLSEP